MATRNENGMINSQQYANYLKMKGGKIKITMRSELATEYVGKCVTHPFSPSIPNIITPVVHSVGVFLEKLSYTMYVPITQIRSVVLIENDKVGKKMCEEITEMKRLPEDVCHCILEFIDGWEIEKPIF